MWDGGEAGQMKLNMRASVLWRVCQKHERCKFVPRLFGVSVYDMKTICCLFERSFEVEVNGVSFFEISFFFLEILTFLYYANLQPDDVVRFELLLNISGNIGVVLFKLGTREVNQTANTMKPVIWLP